MSETSLIVDSRNPGYDIASYLKYRLTYQGGRPFIDKYLQRFDTRESKPDFIKRQCMTHNPGFAGQALDEIIGGICQRMPEIVRAGGTASYTKAVNGQDGGVDLEGSSMNAFLEKKALPELLSIGKVGIYVDMPQFNPFSTLAEYAVVPHPYIYHYKAEDILNWRCQFSANVNELLYTSVLLREYHWIYNDAGLPETEVERFRLVRFNPNGPGVVVRLYEKGVDPQGAPIENVVLEFVLPTLKRLPFVFLDIGKSLLRNAADYQIGLLNLASADLNYAIHSNFPFYVEGYDPKSALLNNKQGQVSSFDADGNTVEATKDSGDTTTEVVVGSMHGRLYPYEAPVPAFINPSAEPLRVSMDKQTQMKEDIRKLLNLAVAGLQNGKGSAESKRIDQSAGLENGLAAIGLELQGAEKEIAQIWASYEGTDVGDKANIVYPATYSLKTDEERLTQATSTQAVQGAAPSKTFQKRIAKQVAMILLNGKVPQSELETIYKEIDAAKYITGDWQAIKSDFELGIVDPETAAEARGYDPALVEKAQASRVQRMAEIAAAQTPDVGAANHAARGVKDGNGNAAAEKTTSQAADNNPAGKAVRGAANGS